MLGLAVAVALARFVSLGRWSFWYDEALTVADSAHGVERGELHNPLGYWLVHAVAEAFGAADERSWRLLPALAGFLVVPLSAWAFRPLADRRRAALAALLLAASSWALYWSQNARFYTLAQLVSVAGVGVFVRALFAGRTMAALGGLVIFALAATLHLSAALACAALGMGCTVLLVVRRSLEPPVRRTLIRCIGLGVLLVLVGSPWVLSAWRTYLVSKQVPAGTGAKLASLAHFYASFGFFVTPLLGGAFLVGACFALRSRAPRALLPLAVVVVGLIAASLSSLFGRVTAQYAFCLLPWIAIVACEPLARLERAGLRAAWIALLVLPALADQALYFGWRYGDRPRWREAFEYVWQERSSDDLVVTMAAPIGEFYLAPLASELRRPQAVAWMDKRSPTLPEEWIGRGRAVWILVLPENLEDWSSSDRELLEAFLREECRAMRSFPVPAMGRDLSLEVYLYPG